MFAKVRIIFDCAKFLMWKVGGFQSEFFVDFLDAQGALDFLDVLDFLGVLGGWRRVEEGGWVMRR